MVHKVLVTGVSGFVGRNVAKKLIMSTDYEVYGVSRSDPQIAGLKHVKADIRFSPENSFVQQFSHSTVVHCAAYAADGVNPLFAETNIGGTENMMKINPGGKFIHMSSSSIYDLTGDSHNVEEDDFTLESPFYNDYSRTKASAEQMVLASMREIPSITLRPHAVYGRDDTTLFPKIAKRVKNFSLLLPGGGQTIHSLTHIDNLVDAVIQTIQFSPSSATAFNITDAHPILLETAVKLMLKDKVKRIKNVPVGLAETLARTKLFSLYEIKQVGYDRTYDISRARTLLNYTPTGFSPC